MWDRNLAIDLIAEIIVDEYEKEKLLKSGDGFQQSYSELRKQFPSCDEREIINIMQLACNLYSYRFSEKSELVVTAPNSFDLRTRKTKTVIEELIKNAEKSITLTGYSISDYFSEMLDILVKKGTQGLYINLYINDLDKHRERIDKLLLYSGRFIKIYSYNRQNEDKMAALHAKIIVVDDKKAFISSANLSYHGMKGNIEMGILIESIEKSKKIQETLKILLSHKIFEKYT